VEDVGKAYVLESRMVEIPHALASSTVDEPPKRIATKSHGGKRGANFAGPLP